MNSQKHQRYEVQHLLGRGGMGSVYAAFDKRRQRRVAMKVMRDSDRASLYRFKREFRAIAPLRHPNLVRLYDLGVLEDGRFFFTMELIEGSPLGVSLGISTEQEEGTGAPLESTAAVETSPQPPLPADINVLGEALVGVVEGLRFLHAAQRVHRDLKPSNVMIDASGHARLLDFGIVRELETGEGWTVHGTVGTPYYMAPEQVSGGPVTAAADLYAFGCILYELLAGQPPFLGTSPQVLAQHLHEPPARPSALRPCDGVLEALALSLLQKAPEHRPTAESVMGTLRRRFGLPPAAALRLPRPRIRQELVGRGPELDHLVARYEEAKRAPRIVFVEGESGVGKSALAAALAQRLQSEGVDTWFGACYEREQVPYQAFDTIVDRAVAALMRRPRDAYRLLPADALALVHLFPVAKEVPAVAQLAPTATDADAEVHRQRAARALTALLTNLGDGAPPLVVLDDLHRAGSDSLDLLSWMAEDDEVPPCLVVATLRAREGRREHRIFSHPQTETMVLRPLGDVAARKLIDNSVAVPLSSEEREILVRDAGGNAFLALELARGVSEAQGQLRLPRLADVVAMRLRPASDQASGVLDVIAAAGGPTPFAMLLATIGLSSSALAEAVDELLHAELLHESSGNDDAYQFAHDRLREAAYDGMPADRRRKVHLDLAQHLAQEGDAARAVEHWRLAGDRIQARRAALEAARQAEDQLAYARAAELYYLATDDHSSGELERRLGAVLARAGRHLEAAEVLERAAARGDEGAREMVLQAATERIAGGDLSGGIAALRSLLAPMRDRVRLGGFRAIASVLLRTVRLLVGWSFDDRRSLRRALARPRPIDDDTAFRLRLYEAVADHLQWHLPLTSTDYAIRYALLARRTGGPAELGRAHIRTAMLLVGIGKGDSHSVFRHLEAGEALCAENGDNLGLLQGHLIRALRALLEGRWDALRTAFQAGAQFARRAGLLGEQTWAILRAIEIAGAFHSGELPRVEELATAYAVEARRRGNASELSLPLTLLAASRFLQGRTDAGGEALRESLEVVSKTPVTISRFYAEMIAASSFLADEQGERALAHLRRLRPRHRAGRIPLTPLEEATRRLNEVRASVFLLSRGKPAGPLNTRLGFGPIPTNIRQELLRLRAAAALQRGRVRRSQKLLDRLVVQATRSDNRLSLALALAARAVVRERLGVAGADLDLIRAEEGLAAIGASDTPLLWMEGWRAHPTAVEKGAPTPGVEAGASGCDGGSPPALERGSNVRAHRD